MRIENDSYNEDDIIKIIDDLKEKHRTVYWHHILDRIFVYKPLGRRDFKELCENEDMTVIEKEDEVCKLCVLYPVLTDDELDNMQAGIVQKLYKVIMKNSYLDSVETRAAVLSYFREELFDFQNQIPCIINEAFPMFDIEDIENWDVERTAKYLANAEFKLQNFRGMEVNSSIIEESLAPGTSELSKTTEGVEELNVPKDEKKPAKNKGGKQAMTPEKLREMKMKFPEINWEADTILTEGEAGMRDSVDSTPVALRTPGQR